MKGCGAGPCPPSSSRGERCDGAALGPAADALSKNRRTVGQPSLPVTGPGRRVERPRPALRTPSQRSCRFTPHHGRACVGTTDHDEASAGPRGLRGFSVLAACETLARQAEAFAGAAARYTAVRPSFRGSRGPRDTSTAVREPTRCGSIGAARCQGEQQGFPQRCAARCVAYCSSQ